MSTERLEQALTVREHAIERQPANPQAEAIGQQARALIEARYIMALRRPRDIDAVRERMIRECRRPLFANDKAVLYHKPIGDGVEGLGVRFAEMAQQAMTNISTEVTVKYEDDERRIKQITVTDLETNHPECEEIVVTKTIERKRIKEGEDYIRTRANSRGEIIYVIPADDDALLNKENAQISKMRRNCVLRLIPGWLKEECEQLIRDVREADAKADPDEYRRKILDGFSQLNVPIEELKEYVGHDLGACSPQELAHLKTVWGSIESGETTWQAVLDKRRDDVAKGKATPATVKKEQRARRQPVNQSKAAGGAESAAGKTPPSGGTPDGAPAATVAGDAKTAVHEQGRPMVEKQSGEIVGHTTMPDSALVQGMVIEARGRDWQVEDFEPTQVIVVAAS